MRVMGFGPCCAVLFRLVFPSMANGRVEQFITVKEAAHALLIRPTTLYKYIQDGNGPPHTRFGRTIRIHVDKFERWSQRGFNRKGKS